MQSSSEAHSRKEWPVFPRSKAPRQSRFLVFPSEKAPHQSRFLILFQREQPLCLMRSRKPEPGCWNRNLHLLHFLRLVNRHQLAHSHKHSKQHLLVTDFHTHTLVIFLTWASARKKRRWLKRAAGGEAVLCVPCRQEIHQCDAWRWWRDAFSLTERISDN